MLTVLGKFLRDIRIKNDEILYDMSIKLGVSPSTLSSVECGKIKMPIKWCEKICHLYQLDSKQADYLKTIVKINNV